MSPPVQMVVGRYPVGLTIGESGKLIFGKALKMISSFDNKDLNMLESMINVGLEYGDNNYDKKMDELIFVNEFPKLNRFLNERN